MFLLRFWFVALFLINSTKSAKIARREVNSYSYPIPAVGLNGGRNKIDGINSFSSPGHKSAGFSGGNFNSNFGVGKSPVGSAAPHGHTSNGGGNNAAFNTGGSNNFGGNGPNFVGGPAPISGSISSGRTSGGGAMMMGASYMRSSSPYYNFQVMLD